MRTQDGSGLLEAGEFQRLRSLIAMQRRMLELVASWRPHLPPASGVEEGALAFWHHHSTFNTTAEFEANVVMLLFAGTQNLENVLGHAVRLLLAHPEQLAALRQE